MRGEFRIVKNYLRKHLRLYEIINFKLLYKEKEQNKEVF